MKTLDQIFDESLARVKRVLLYHRPPPAPPVPRKRAQKTETELLAMGMARKVKRAAYEREYQRQRRAAKDAKDAQREAVDQMWHSERGRKVEMRERIAANGEA